MRAVRFYLQQAVVKACTACENTDAARRRSATGCESYFLVKKCRTRTADGISRAEVTGNVVHDILPSRRWSAWLTARATRAEKSAYARRQTRTEDGPRLLWPSDVRRVPRNAIFVNGLRLM